LWHNAGVLRATIIVKITLGLLHERTAWPTTTVDLVVEDRRRDANPLSSLVEAAETPPYLPNAGVILFANAFAPQGRPAAAMSARLALFREHSLIDKTVHIFGERAANAPQHPRPFERVPLVYERTWGGPGSEDNPVGVPAGASSLPSICDPTNPTKSAGFGPISRQWPHRKRLLGAADLTRIEAPVAEFPNGFDFRYYNPAPTDQQIEFLRGDEWIVLDGMHPTLPRVQSRLPQMRGKACVYFVSTNTVNHTQFVDLVQDMLVIDADELVASVVFRGSIQLDSLDVLPRLRVFADVELPGNPTRWPEGAEVLRAPAPAAMTVAKKRDPAPATSILAAFPANEDSAIRAALPFQPKPIGSKTVVPFISAPPARPRVDLGDDPLMRTVTADVEDSALRPVMPFADVIPAPAPRFPPPSAATSRRQHDDDNATRAIDLEQLEAKRIAVTPFHEGAPRGISFDKPEAKWPIAKSFDNDESTCAIDIEKLEAQRAAVIPFAGTDAAKPLLASSFVPGAPWPNPHVGSTVQPPLPAHSDVAPRAPTQAFNIDDPLTQSAVRQDVTALPFTRSSPPPFGAVASPDAVAPPPARVEPPAFIKPPAFVDAPARVEAPAMMPAAVSAPVAASSSPPPPLAVPVVQKDSEPFAAAVSAPARVAPDEPREKSSTPPPAVESAPSAVVAPVVDETGVRATIIERLRSGVPAPLHGLVVTNADLSGLDMRGSNLSSHDLGGVKFCKTNLSGARLGGARLVDADLADADLSSADLAGADLSRATLTNTRLSGATIDNACFSSASGAGAVFDGSKGRAALFVRGQWTNASFRNIDVLGADFTGATLDGAIFERAVLLEVKLNDARGKGAKFDDARMDQGHADGSALTECSFRNVDAKGSTWENATLDGSSFDDARMENAIFVRTSCRESKFVNANLRAANFGRAQGDAANLGGANLDGADFRQARFSEARFEGARMSNILAPRADFSRSNFVRADLSNGSLRAAQLGGSNLAHAILDGADLRDADLKRSVLFKASRTGAKLSGANTKDSIETEPTE